MFDSLKKKLREGVARLSNKAEIPAVEKPAEGKVEERPKRPGVARPGPARRVRPKRLPKAKPGEEKRENIEKEEIAEEPVTEKPPERKPEGVEEKPEIEESEVEEFKAEEPLFEKPKEEPEKRSRLASLRGIRERVSARELTERDIDDFFGDGEVELLQSDVALGVVDSLKEKLKERLVSSEVRRGRASEAVEKAFEESLLEIVDQGSIDLEGLIKKSRKEGRPLLMVFLGFNGSGKTTSIAKCASYLKGKGFRPVLAAADTFRAASIEQLEVHGERLGIKVIKHQYGSDSAAVVFDAVKYAGKNRLDVVLADTAGRAHTDRNLMDELSKVVRVNKPELKVLVVDSLTGSDAVEQARKFHEAVDVDCVVMTKTDVNPRGGSILSVVHTIRKPILFLGTGQEYSSVEMFSPRKFVKQLLE